MIPYIGDISREDALALCTFAKQASCVLEFGVGASTQVLRAYSTGRMISVETDDAWVERTKANLELLGIHDPVEFVKMDQHLSSEPFDLVFVDGADELRLPFAIRSWRGLSPGGRLMFHDTRRHRDFLYVTHLIAMFGDEIQSVVIGCNHSNVSVLEKSLCNFQGSMADTQDELNLRSLTKDKNALVIVGRKMECLQLDNALGNVVKTMDASTLAVVDSDAAVARISAEGVFVDVIIAYELNEYVLSIVMRLWSSLNPHGYLLLQGHDNLGFAMEVILRFWSEIASFHPRLDCSGFSAIGKKNAEPYVNWNDVEGREAWEFGWAEPNVEKVRERLAECKAQNALT